MQINMKNQQEFKSLFLCIWLLLGLKFSYFIIFWLSYLIRVRENCHRNYVSAKDYWTSKCKYPYA